MTTKETAQAPGYATSDGTKAYAERIAVDLSPDHLREALGLRISSIGLGTYLGASSDATDRLYENAIRKAVLSGVNHLDSAINYRCQRSERSIGRALSTLFEEGAVRRDEVVVATKGGFIPFDGDQPRDPQKYFEDTFLYPGILQPEEIAAGCHSLAPRYLDHQLEQSRRNLGLATVDIYYIHNPEIQLTEIERDEFLLRMEKAFRLLEEKVSEEKIRFYGTATWDGFRRPPEAQDHLSLAELLRVAERAGGKDHHFRAVQLPYNLAMPEAYAAPSQILDGEPVPFLAAAKRLGIVANSSASIYQSHLARGLPPFLSERLPGLSTDAQRAIQFARSTPGVVTALVGMKQESHVDENLATAKVPVASPETIRTLFAGGEPEEED